MAAAIIIATCAATIRFASINDSNFSLAASCGVTGLGRQLELLQPLASTLLCRDSACRTRPLTALRRSTCQNFARNKRYEAAGRDRLFKAIPMRKLLIALAAMALLTAPADAQFRGKGSKRAEGSQQPDDQKKKNAAAEKAYKDALRRIPDQKVADPWSSMRLSNKWPGADSCRRISEAVVASASTAQRNPPYAFPRSVVRALLEPPVHVVWRVRLADAEGTDEVRNAAGKGKACGILRIEALRRGLRLAPQLGLVDGQQSPCPQHERAIDHDAIHRCPAFRK